MENKGQLTLWYVRDGQTQFFPVKNVKHAIALANALANSDLINDDVDYNMIDLVYMDVDREIIFDSWKDEETGQEFDEYWKMEDYK